MRFPLLALTLLGTTAAFAQANVVVIAAQPNCPVGFVAQASGSGTTLWTTSLEDARNPEIAVVPHTPESGVHVELNASGRSRGMIQQAELVVDFLPPGLRYMPAGSGNLYALKGTPEQVATKTFSLAADKASAHLAGDLLVGPSASIKRVHLLSVQYADGSTWHADARKPCSIEPNRFLRINAK